MVEKYLGAATEKSLFNFKPLSTFEIEITQRKERKRKLIIKMLPQAGLALDRASGTLSELTVTEYLCVKGVLVGNKSDLASRREVETAVAQEWAQEQGLQYHETSTVSGL